MRSRFSTRSWSSGQKSYGAGQQVTATASAESVDKNVRLKDTAVDIAITIDGSGTIWWAKSTHRTEAFGED